MKKVIIWGAGGTGKRILKTVSEKYEVISFVDSDRRKWGTMIDGIYIKTPEMVTDELFDYVIIASQPGYEAISQQLLEYGVGEEKVITSYVVQPLQARIMFLENIAKEIIESNSDGVCAEAGVFEGDFAKHINRCFPNKKLYLFDTFEGFDEKDIKIEQSIGLSNASVGDYSLTSIATVMDKMKYPKNVKIFKGYFPDTAQMVSEQFCFVNLDLDLYLPTFNGLKWLRSRMVKNGVVLVHDYYSEVFDGPKKAVDEFMRDNTDLKKYPIGDGISVMIAGF